MSLSRMFSHIQINNHRPNKAKFIKNLMGEDGNPDVPLVEYIIHDSIIKTIMTEMLNREWIEWGSGPKPQKGYLDNFIEIWYRLGYDFVRFEQSLAFSEKHLSGKDRSWVDQQQGTIRNWHDFEKYNWPKVEDFDFSSYEYLNKNLPDGMGLIVSHGGGVFEHLSQIMSFEGLCYSLTDNHELVLAITDKLGNLMSDFYKHIIDLDNVIALWPGDDMGYRTGTMISPDDLREFILPWHKHFATMAHDRNLQYFLHSCGNVLAIMDDLIEDIKIDGKHSFEDAIIPIDKFQQFYGERTAVLGGIDINILSAGTIEDVRNRTRFLIEKCGKFGRFGIGSGNSIPDYVSAENYLAMIDEKHRIGKH